MIAMDSHGGEAELDALRRQNALLVAANGQTATQRLLLWDMVQSQGRMIELQMQQIQLLEAGQAPLGWRGQARLRRSPRWLQSIRWLFRHE